MREVGIDISHRKPKKIELVRQLHADKAITLNCRGSCPYVIGGIEDWDVDDPAGQPLEKVRVIRDDIEQRVRNLAELRADEIRADRSGHARRLAQLLPNLVAEFDGMRTPEEIRACADAILNSYDDAPVRSFVLTLADRDARDCLRADSCYAITGRVLRPCSVWRSLSTLSSRRRPTLEPIHRGGRLRRPPRGKTYASNRATTMTAAATATTATVEEATITPCLSGLRGLGRNEVAAETCSRPVSQSPLLRFLAGCVRTLNVSWRTRR